MEFLKVFPVNEYLLDFAIILFVICFFQGYLKRNSQKLPPGPRGLPILGYFPFIGSEPYKTFFDMKKKYGNIISFRFGSNRVVILNEYEVVKETLNHPGSWDREQYLFGSMPMGFIVANGQQWVEERRFCMHAMRNLGFGRKRWEGLIEDSILELMDDIAPSKGQPVDITEKLHVAISNNIVVLLIGRKLHTDSEKDKLKLLTQYSGVFLNYVQTFRVDFLIPGFRSLFEYLGLFEYGRAARIISSFIRLAKEEIKKHNMLEDCKYLEDFINSYDKKMKLMTPEVKRNFFSDEELLGNISILFLATSDTIFSSLCWLIRLIAAYQDVQKKIQQELDDVIGTDGTLSFDDRTKVPYTMAVLMEAQRFSSIVPISTTRIANQDFEIRGYTIPKGALIMPNLWALHNDPDYFEKPDLFIPERFLLKGENKINRNVPSFAPFSIGRRNCPGETMAYMVIFLFITKLLQRFTISSPPGVETKFDIVGGLVQYLKPQELCFTERN